MSLPTASDNKFPKLVITEGTAPSSPSAGDQKLYIDSTSHHLSRKNSSGTVVDLETNQTAGAFVGCRAYNNGTQSISDSTITAVTFASESYDSSTIHDTGSNTSKFTVSATGKWRFTGGTTWDSNTTGARYVWWRIDGTTEVDGGMIVGAPVAVQLGQQSTVTLSLTSGQYVEFMVYQTSGGARTIGGTSADKKFESFCECQYLGA